MNRRRVAWILILIVEVGYIAWGAGAALSPEHLLGPGGKAILPAGYEGYSGMSWSALTSTSPASAAYMAVLYRMYGVYNVLFGLLTSGIAITAFRRGEHWAWWVLLVGNTIALVSAMTYDKAVNAIGPFELTEYLGLAMVWAALFITAPFRTASRRVAVASEGSRRHAMKHADPNDQVLPYPKSRRFLEAAMRSTHHKPMIHGLLEIDVSSARASLRDYQTRTGEPLSFTAFIIACVGKAVDENKAVHALRLGSSRVIQFGDVDVLTWIERDAGGQEIILPYIVRAANHKTVDQIHGEIRTAQVQDLSKTIDGGAKALQALPAWLYPAYFWLSTWIGRRYPRQWKKNWGTVTVSAVGMFGKGAGWGVPPSTPSLCWITLGGMAQRRSDVNGHMGIREYLSLTVSFDHNMIDGAPAARFTQRLKELIENGYGLPNVTNTTDDVAVERPRSVEHALNASSN